MRAQFKTKLVTVEVGKLRLHAAANRDLQPARVKKLVREMDLDSLGVFSVWRDGRDLYVIDGQHRKVALEELGLSDYPVDCKVYEGMTFADACERFLTINSSLVVRPYDKYDKGVKAGRMAEVESKKVVEAAGLQISDQHRDGQIACVTAVVDVWKLDQGEALAKALRWATESWGHTASAVEGQVIRGLGQVAFRVNGQLDEPAFIKKLSKFPGGPGNLLGAAKARREFKPGTVASNLASITIDLYNKGRRAGKVVL